MGCIQLYFILELCISLSHSYQFSFEDEITCFWMLVVSFLNLRSFFSAQSILGFKMPKKLQMFLLVMLSNQDSSSSQWWIGSRERPWGLVNNLELWIFYTTSKIPRCLFSSITKASRYILMELPSVGYCWFPIRWRSWGYQGHFQKDRHRWWRYCFYWRTEEWSSKVWFTTWRVWSTNAYWSSKSCLK